VFQDKTGQAFARANGSSSKSKVRRHDAERSSIVFCSFSSGEPLLDIFKIGVAYRNFKIPEINIFIPDAADIFKGYNITPVDAHKPGRVRLKNKHMSFVHKPSFKSVNIWFFPVNVKQTMACL